MTDSIIGFILGLIVLFFMVFSFTGCETVVSKNVFEDKRPVAFAVVTQWSDNLSYETFTDVNGTWSLIIPVGTEWNLCIENPEDYNTLCCYDGLLTVNEKGDLK